MDDYSFSSFRNLLQNRCGLYFTSENREDLERGLMDAMRQSSYTSEWQYYQALEHASSQEPVWRTLINLLMIGETYFFREQAHFKALREHILPPIIEDRRAKKMRILRLWSAGCSTGEEPYSLAILLHQMIPDIHEWNITIRATDINHRALERARHGMYGQWSFRMETPSEIMDRYFIERSVGYEIMPDIRRMVQFSYLNLVEDDYPSLPTGTTNMDVIFCRNVTIYFDKDTTRRIARKFYNSLVDGGWLMVGHSEPLASVYSDFETHNLPNTTVYRRAHQFFFDHLRQSEKANQLYKSLLDTNIDPEATPFTFDKTENYQSNRLERVYDLVTHQEPEKAREEITHQLEEMPNTIDGLFLLAKVAADEGEFDGVHDILDMIEDMNPLVPQAHYLRALLYQQSQAWNEAKSALRKALYADRNFALAHYYMGELLYTEGNLKQARRYWMNAADLLADSEKDSLVPYGDDTTVGTLLHAIEQRLKS